MLTRILFIALVAFLTNSCGGGDKHLPSSNPPEYDPKKVYTPPATTPSVSATVAKPTEIERLRSKLDSLESGAQQKGEGKKVPVSPDLLQLFKGVTNPCEALSRLAPGLGSTQLFAGQEGAALKKALGPDADEIARRMDEQLAEGLKRSLGPAADCPISVRPQKKSDFSQPARLVLAHASSAQPLLFAQTTIPDTSQNDYDVVPNPPPPLRRENAPPEWVGWKTTDTMTRVGKEHRPTKGIREDYEMVIAPKAKRCPHLEGPDLKGMVDGTFEWSFMMFRATPGPQSVLYRRKVQATLKGEVGDDAQLKKKVKFDATVTLQHIGSELPHYSQTFGIQGEFSIDQRTGIPHDFKIITVSGFSEGEAQAKDAQLIGTLTAIMAWFSGPEYVNAQTIWNNPNTCVEITFTPATKTKKFVPSESTPVKTELRTKKEKALVPAKFKEARERPGEGNGRVSPREKESRSAAPATFTYQAPPTRVRHSGFWVVAVSRAGVAEANDGEWELAEGAYILEFQSRIVDSELTAPAESVAAGKVTLTLVEGKDMYRGSGMVGYQTGPPPNRDPCTSLIMGHGTTRLDVAGMFIKLSERTGPAGSQVASADIELHYLIHPTNETERPVTYVDYQCVPGKPLPHPFFYGMYAVSRGAEEINLLKGWMYVGRNGVVATKTLHGNCGDHCEDVTVFTLKESDSSEAMPTH